MAEEILARLKYDNKTKEIVSRLVKWHDHVIEPNEAAVKRMLSKSTPDFFFDLVALKRADNLAQHPDFHNRQGYYDEIESLAKSILARQDCLTLKDLKLKGGDLIALGMTPGKALGDLLSEVFAEVLQNRLPNDRDILMDYVKNKLK